MKPILISFLALIAIFSNCKKKEENKPADLTIQLSPSLDFTDSNNEPIKKDTLKISLKSPRQEGMYYLKIGGDNKPKEITSKTINGSGTLTVGGKPEGTSTFPNGTYTVVWKPTAPGTTLLKIELRDSKQNKREASVEISAFENMLPVAELQLIKLGKVAPLEYLIDANSSFDKDAKFGGGIVYYEYFINGKTFKTDRPSIKYNFETTGEHQLGVKVIDLDGGVAEYKNKFEIF